MAAEPRERRSVASSPKATPSPATPPSAHAGDEIADLARRAVERLKRETDTAIRSGDLATAERLVAEYKSRPYRNYSYSEVWEIEEKIIAAKRLIALEKERREAEIAALWSDHEKRVVAYIAEERFDAAIAETQPFLTYPPLNDRARKLMEEVERARGEFLAKTMPERRALIPVLYLELRPLTGKGDFASALKKTEELRRDPRFTPHRPLLDAETRRLNKCAKGVQIPEKEREPIVAGELLLYAGEFASAGAIAVEATSVNPSSPELVQFFERLQLIVDALRPADVDSAIAKGDPALLKHVKARYEPLEENGEWRKELDGRLALANIADPSLKNIKPELARLVAKLDETSAEDADLASRTKLAEEKIKAIKTLRIVAEEKEIVSLIAKGLEDQSSQVRMETCRIIAGVGVKDQKVIWKIVKLLDDPLPQIGEAVAETLTKLKIDPNIVKAKAKSEDGDDRRLSAVLAGALREKTFSSMLTTLLKDPLWPVRKASAVGLAKIGDGSVSSALLTALKAEKESDEVQVALAYALARLDKESAVPAISGILKNNPHHRFKRDLLRYIGEIGGSKAAVALKPYLRDLDEWIRFQAAEGMSKTGVKPDMDEIRRLLVDDSWMVRGAAARWLAAEGKGEKPLELLVRLLDDKDAPVRGEAVVGLERWREERVIPAIIKEMPALADEGQKIAAGILGTLTGQKFSTKEEWERWWSLNKGTFRLLPVEKRHEVPKEKQ